MSTPATDFHSMFARSDDPWGFRSRWYEERKRALTLAALPQRRFACAFEPGCANGELAAGLAPRCDALWAQDGVPEAVVLARRRLAAHAHAHVIPGWVPKDWPELDASGNPLRFDLVVLSELGYYLSADDLDRLADRIVASLRAGGVVLACHWRRPIDGCHWAGDAVNEALGRRFAREQPSRPAPSHLLRIADADLRLDVWQDHPQSVAEREGLAGPG